MDGGVETIEDEVEALAVRGQARRVNRKAMAWTVALGAAVLLIP